MGEELGGKVSSYHSQTGASCSVSSKISPLTSTLQAICWWLPLISQSWIRGYPWDKNTVTIEKTPTWSPLCLSLILAQIQACWHIFNGGSVHKLTHCRQAILLLCGNLPFPFPTVSLVNSYKLSQTAGCVLKSIYNSQRTTACLWGIVAIFA